MALFDVKEILLRVLKYLIEGFMVAIAAFAIPKKSLNLEEIGALSITAAATFAVLDTYLPAMSVSAHQGTGLGIGLGLAGF